MPIPPQKIIELAEASGFASELKVAGQLSLRNWHPSQSVYYFDKDDKKGRELDLHGWKLLVDSDSRISISCLLNLCIEVKKTKEPFIFFSSVARAVEAGRGFSNLHWRWNIGTEVLSYNSIERCKPFAKPERIARSFMSAKDGGAQQIRSGVISAFKAAIHYTEECDERFDDNSRDISFFIPLLVVEGPIYECFLNDGSDKYETQEVQQISLQQNYLSTDYGIVSNIVQVVSLEYLPEALVQYEHWGQDILTQLVETRMTASERGIKRGGLGRKSRTFSGEI